MSKIRLGAEPWRYRCTECGSVSLTVRTQTRPKEVLTTMGGDPNKTTERIYAPRYYCDGCNTGLQRLKDAKTGEVVEV